MPPDTTVIRVDGVSKRFVIKKDKSLKERAIHLGRSKGTEDFWALRDIDLEVAAGSTLGLVGHNGSGKSTLLKLIGGILQPTTGSVAHRGRLAALLELGAGFHPDLTGRENVYLNASILGLSKKQTEEHFDDIVAFSGIERFIDTQVKFYSSGMYVRLAFAVAVHVDPEVLLVDEVLSVGDEPFQRKCMDRIHQFQTEGRTIVLVSHSQGQVGDLCDTVVVLDGGRMLYQGDVEAGLRVLRHGYEEARLEEIATKSEDDVRPRATITAVTVLDEQDRHASQLEADRPARIVLDVEAHELLQDWRAGISIETPLSQVAFGTNTTLLGIPMPRISGRAQVVFCVPRLALLGGQYYVTAALETPAGAAIDWKSQAVMFDVVSRAKGVGVANLDTHVDVRAAADLR